MKLIITIFAIIFCISTKAQVTAMYSYDNLHRLTQASYSNGVGIQYSYDTLGNRTQETKTSTLSVEDFGTTKSFALYPNPFQEELNISSKDQSIKQVQLYDITGKIIQDEKVNSQKSFTLKTNGLQRGTYLITISTDTGKETYKILKK